MLSDLAYSAYSVFILKPLRKIYEYGPEFRGFGFWAGKTAPQICATLTGNSEIFWISNLPDCLDLIDVKFYTMQATLETVAHFLLLAIFFKMLIVRIFQKMEPRHVMMLVPVQSGNLVLQS